MSRRHAARVMRHFIEAARKGRTGKAGGLEGLSPRENDVLRMLADGLTRYEQLSMAKLGERVDSLHYVLVFLEATHNPDHGFVLQPQGQFGAPSVSGRDLTDRPNAVAHNPVRPLVIG